MCFKFFFSVAVVVLLAGSASAQNKLKTGIWRGVLKNQSGHEVPFNFDVRDTSGRQELFVMNGAERYRVTDIRVSGDSVFIHMPLFNSEFRLKYGSSNLAGYWIKHYGYKDVATPFHAEYGRSWRFFSQPEKPAYNVSGRWTAIFDDGGKKDTTVGEFKQKGADLTGTFLTTTGDYRYLQGSVSGDKIYLSCFDGGHAYLFTAELKDEKTLENGKYYAGFSDLETWSGHRNEHAKLPDAYSLTKLKPGYKSITFAFEDLSGKRVSLADAKFKNKVVIVQMLGSWCPNCMDETSYLIKYYKKYHPRGVEIIGLAYERTTDPAKSKPTLQQLKTRFNIPYPLLVTGHTPDLRDAQKSLPELADFIGFPTTIIIDKKGDVRKIHTGFSGPGTGKYYAEFTQEFEKLTDSLLAE